MKPPTAVLVVLSLAGCAGPAADRDPVPPDPAPHSAARSEPVPLSAADHAALVEEVRAVELAFAATMAARDHDAFRSFLAEDAVFFAGDTPLRGRDAVAAAWKPLFEGPDAPFSWAPDLVEVLASGDLALTSGPVTGADGSPGGRFNSIWRRGPEGWRVVFDKGEG